MLFVAGGWYQQEDDIETHLLDLGHDVTVKADYQVYGSTDLSVYDLVVITEFAPNLSYSALDNIESSEVPVLIVEYWDFWYSYQLGLTSTEQCGYVGTDTVEVLGENNRFTRYVGREPQVYETSYTVYGISAWDLEEGVVPVAYSSRSFDEYAVLVDPERRIAATGVYDTTRFTERGWQLFDTLLAQVQPPAPEWEDAGAQVEAYAQSGLLGYIDHLTGREPADEVYRRCWRTIHAYHLHQLIEHLNERRRPASGSTRSSW
ncbi:MAG: hypothetical protein R6V85_08815 [Polyangia bacterium]